MYEDTTENKVKQIGRRGQTSWLWAFAVVSIGLLFSTWIWIILDEVLTKYRTPVIDQAAANANTLGLFDGLWAFLPFIFLFSWGLFNWVIADQARGQQV